MGELYINTTGLTTGWKTATEVYIDTTGLTTGWKLANEMYINIDGSSTGWKQFWPSVWPELLSASQGIAEKSASPCSLNKCVRCVSWEADNASDANEHIRVRKSVGGGTYGDAIDDALIDRRCGTIDNCTATNPCSAGGTGDLLGCYCDTGCEEDGTSTQFIVRLETDGGDILAGPNCEITTTSLSTCGAPS